MLWLALRFPALPLETCVRAGRPAGPLIVASGTGAHSCVVMPNRAARRLGIRSGMRLPAALALAADLHVVMRDAAAERSALERIAAWTLQFTPVVSLAPPDEILLEISGSLALFGELQNLPARIIRGLRELGYAALSACAPTPLAAQLFARAGLDSRISDTDALSRNLGRLPADVLDCAPRKLLRDFGLRTIADILRLPRSGLASRFGQQLPDDLDRALGRLPDPRPAFTPPAQFSARQLLPAPADTAAMVLFAVRRLLSELCGYLCASQQGIQHLRLELAHDDRTSTSIKLHLSTATRDAAHLTNVLRERLERTALPRPVIDVTLECRLLLPLPASSLSWLPDAAGDTVSTVHLIERLRTRLGEDAVYGLGIADDHRPEHAWHCTEPAEYKHNYLILNSYFFRPLWLLPAPRLLTRAETPSDGRPLKLLGGAERIESGWWDGRSVMRDYYVARSRSGALLWIFQQRGMDGGWFLHGYFA